MLALLSPHGLQLTFLQGLRSEQQVKMALKMLQVNSLIEELLHQLDSGLQSAATLAFHDIQTALQASERFRNPVISVQDFQAREQGGVLFIIGIPSGQAGFIPLECGTKFVPASFLKDLDRAPCHQATVIACDLGKI